MLYPFIMNTRLALCKLCPVPYQSAAFWEEVMESRRAEILVIVGLLMSVCPDQSPAYVYSAALVQEGTFGFLL